MAIQALTVAPLPIPAAALATEPFVDAPWCPDVLRQVVFGGTQKTYVLFDSGLCARIAGGFDPDVLASTHETKCLFTGGLMDAARDVAPYLVDLTLTDAPPSTAQRNFAKSVWGKSAAIVIRTDASFAALWQHLRKFTRIRSSMAAEGWTYFRFWDPLVAATYFGAGGPRPTLGHRFFNVSDETRLTVVIEDGANAATLIWPSKQDPQGRGQAGIFLEATDHILMAKAAQRAFRHDLGKWLLAQHSDRFAGFSPVQLRALTRHVVQQAERLGWASRDDMVYLCHVMLSTWGWFHLTGVLPRLGAMIGQPKPAARDHLAEAFMQDSNETAKAGVLAQWGDLYSFIKALPAEEQITPQHFRTLLNRFLADRPEAVGRALQAAKSDLPALALPEIMSGKVLLLSLILGHRFYMDPTLPWIALSPEHAIGAAWEATFG